VDLLGKLQTLETSPSCPASDSVSLPEGWESYLQPVPEDSYGVVGGQQAPEVNIQ
jgi:hypothetical protein